MLFKNREKDHTCKAIGTRCFLFLPPDSEQEGDDWLSLMFSSIFYCLPSRASRRVQICPSVEFICVNCRIEDRSVCKTFTKELDSASLPAQLLIPREVEISPGKFCPGCQ